MRTYPIFYVMALLALLKRRLVVPQGCKWQCTVDAIEFVLFFIGALSVCTQIINDQSHLQTGSSTSPYLCTLTKPGLKSLCLSVGFYLPTEQPLEFDQHTDESRFHHVWIRLLQQLCPNVVLSMCCAPVS